MNILIDTIRIAGFRGIKNLEVSLPRVAVLIGTNNSGKTSLLKALQLALGDYSRYLSEEDFFIGTDDKRVPEILIDVRFVPIGDNGIRTQIFNEEWATEFGDKIQAEVNGNQFVALRTRAALNTIKGVFESKRFTLERWLDLETWQTEKIKETKMLTRFESMPFISIEAQRDIHQELKERSSFIGKVLSSIEDEYNPTEITALESLIKKVNDETVNKSNVLLILKTHLEQLNRSFQGLGSADITPFPKKIRDLSKHFSIHFGESSSGTFSMEYHGMGTRSWASMLTVKVFTDLMAVKHEKEAKPFFPILAAEEPEAHLHPNAQKTLYSQLAESKGQVIVSTHSPYLAAMADQSELRYLKKSSDCIVARHIGLQLGPEDRRRLQREVIHSRGEILFSKALVLCEGETEEQALPILFKKYFGDEAFVLGVNFIGVGGSGKKYLPFLTFAKEFSIPIFIFSDGEELAIKGLKKSYEKVFGETNITKCPNITILDNTDFEGYLISSGFKTAIEAAIKELDGVDAIEKWIELKHETSAGRKKTSEPPCSCCKQSIYVDVFRDYKSSDGYDKALMSILDSSKPKYAPAIADKICELDPEYLFSWDKIPGNDNGILIEFLNRHFTIEWIKTADIEKIDGGRAIKVSTGKNNLSLSLNDEKTKVDLKIDDVRTYKFIAKTENNKLNIYIEKFPQKVIELFKKIKVGVVL
jgi:putative ATP-dependent endonuclease of OLD family